MSPRIAWSYSLAFALVSVSMAMITAAILRICGVPGTVNLALSIAWWLALLLRALTAGWAVVDDTLRIPGLFGTKHIEVADIRAATQRRAVYPPVAMEVVAVSTDAKAVRIPSSFRWTRRGFVAEQNRVSIALNKPVNLRS